MWHDCSRPDAALRVLAALLLCAVLVLFLGWKSVVRWLDAPLSAGEPVIAELPAGGNLTRLLRELGERGVLDRPNWLRLHARLSGVADQVRAGEYRIEPGLTPRALLAMLVAGKVVVYSVTLVEGNTATELLARLHAQDRLQRTLDAPDAATLARALELEPAAWPSAEGAFLPETYQYHRGMSDADVLRAAHAALAEALDEEWAMRAPGLPYASPYEALVMASLVEKETGLAEERARIAGVFVRRLQQRMLLQTDPAVIYGLGARFDGNLTREHLRAPGPYNTYLNPGLPPSPIANVGRAAIRAALQPAPGTELYFVARGDGSHQFSDTLEEHNRAVRRYQLRRGGG
ncbi:MAG: Endolytic murein transglycosylase [Pseudomonadales bacterium]|nr:Endolytic murein transglycosylase [Pseudomonadales bacterium]